jgi:hypothetical protein
MVFFKHKHLTNPAIISPTDALIAVAANFACIIKQMPRCSLLWPQTAGPETPATNLQGHCQATP